MRTAPLFALFAAALPAHAGDDIIARMGDLSLRSAEVRQLAERLPDAARTPQALEQLARTEIIRRGVAAEARRQGWDKKPEIAARMDQAAEQALVAAYVDSIARPAADYPPEDLVRQAYEAGKAGFTLPARYRVSQIYVAGTDAKARARAEDLYKQAGARNADFAALARKASEHPASAAQGGDMGWLAEKDLLPAIAKALAGLKQDEVARPVQGAEGYHILRLADAKAAELQPLDRVRPTIVQALRLRKARETEAAYLDGLLAKTPVAVNGIGLGELAKAR